MGWIRWRAGLMPRAWVPVLVVMLLVGNATSTSAQTFAEWFRQKKTQQKYLLEQLAALQVFAGQVKKGYELAGERLGLIRGITRGEFTLHEGFIYGLKKVNPLIKGDFRVLEVMGLQLSVAGAFSSLKRLEGLPWRYRDYVEQVADEVTSEGEKDLEELLLVITSGKLEMEDAQRLDRLEGIYLRSLDRWAFARDFCAKVRVLVSQQKSELEELIRIGRWHENR